MARRSYLRWVKDGLFVRYQASAEPQELRLTIVMDEEVSRGPSNNLLQVERSIKWGAAGGAEFAPWLGDCSPVGFAYSRPKLAEATDRFDYTLRVAGVSPRFIRCMVERLSTFGRTVHNKKMRIEGALPITDSETAVTEREIDAWIDDPTTYPRLWVASEMPLELAASDAGVTVEVDFADAPSQEIVDRLETNLTAWINHVANYLTDDGGRVNLLGELGKRIPTFERRERGLAAHYRLISNAREPSRAVLVNMLACCHHKVAPFTRVRVAM